MRKIGEVLRLRAAGLSIPDIARSTSIGRTTVYEYLARAEAAALSWPLPLELDEAAVEAKLFPPACVFRRNPISRFGRIRSGISEFSITLNDGSAAA
jgi:hypothetical protein